MSFINYMAREINCKIVYYGPGLCGKTTNLQYIYERTNPEAKGKMISLATETDRTLFFADELGGDPATAAFAADRGPAALLIGPEGGFDDAERGAVRSLPQAHPISLGPRILRGETAAIAAIAIWMSTAGDW